MYAAPPVWMTSGSNTQRRESGPQQSAPWGSTTGSAAHVHGPIGVSDVATAIALPPPGNVVSVTVTYSRYRVAFASYSISGAQMPAVGVAHEGRLLNASPTYVQWTRSRERICGTRWKLNASPVRSASLSGSDVQYR